MTYTTSQITQILQAEISATETNIQIHHLLIDSRRIISPKNSLFFAIKGERHDGHKYIRELHEKGIRNFVVSEEVEPFPDAVFIKVEDTVFAFQQLAAYHRSQFQIPVIGITGSNGKTVVKEWLHQLLSPEKNIVRSPKSYNSQVGVPLSVWLMNEQHEMAIFEAGISRPSEMEALEKIIHPTIGIFTNIGQAHSEGFSSIQQKVDEKLKLFCECETLIYCIDKDEISEGIQRNGFLKKIKKLTWSKNDKGDLKIKEIKKEKGETAISAIYKNQELKIVIPFVDEASIENAIHCWLLLLHLGCENQTVSDRMCHLTPVAMRLEQKKGTNNCTIINDSYNSDLGSLAIALDFLNQQNQHHKKTLILSDILQSGRDSRELYSEVAQMMSAKGVSRFIGIGKEISQHFQQFDISEKKFYFSTDDFLKGNSVLKFANEAVLLKGARKFSFEKISNRLQQKSHETVLEINLNAIIDNLNYFRSKLNPSTKIMAMVKAFSYGSGSYEIANLLQFHRVDYLAVAYADEGVELRKAGIVLPIMVMNPKPGSINTLIKNNLEPEIYSMNLLRQFTDSLNQSMSTENLPYPVHIKLDTGMHRLGFSKDDLHELKTFLENEKNIAVKSVFSHLAAADEPQQDDFTRKQIEMFKEMCEKLQLGSSVIRHLLNSAGVSRFTEAEYEMVRLGIGLYGVGVDENEQRQLENVTSLKTSISQIQSVKKGETIGYGRRGVAENDLKIATVAIGYADGLNRKLGSGNGKMVVNGKIAPIIGNICMDMCMLDITGINCMESDEVIVFGGRYPIAEFAMDLETIPYEVLTSISQRVKRVYFQE